MDCSGARVIGWCIRHCEQKSPSRSFRWYVFRSYPQQATTIKLLSDIQPQFFPRLHYFARMLSVHEFVLRNDVQFVRNHRYPDGGRHSSYQIHTPIISRGQSVLIRSQVQKKSELAICEQRISYEPDWTRKFVNLLDDAYRKSPHYRQFRAELIELLSRRYRSVADLNRQSILWALCRLLGEKYVDAISLLAINAVLESSRQFPLTRISEGTDYEFTTGTMATDKILALCTRNGCDGYVAGGTAVHSYLDKSRFAMADLKLYQQDWICQRYPQSNAGVAEFVGNLSFIDLIANCSREEACAILTQNVDLIPVSQDP